MKEQDGGKMAKQENLAMAIHPPPIMASLLNKWNLNPGDHS